MKQIQSLSSTELQEFALEATFSLDLAPQAAPASPNAHRQERGQQGLLRGETTVPRDTPGEMRFAGHTQHQQLPRKTSFFSILHSEKLQPPSRQSQSQGHHSPGHSLELQRFHLLQTGFKVALQYLR